ncbi:SH2 domain-containing adapter protein D [Triplophysa tibetana]|uniref:SH2 domain-containing adapter protein D n=1 Tax=Triplophysa tibetana TaxID=1572043 RepID=A0A5A9PCH9_9TELE|nr:SH2 domain-containing adapter protein D [Triplophysa tibetana]
MAKWFRNQLSFGSRKGPPQPPKPDYTESEILRAYRLQKELDFEDPYEPLENRVHSRSGSLEVFPSFGTVLSNGVEVKIVSPKHRLIKVESQEFGRSKIPLNIVTLEEPQDPVVPSAPAVGESDYSDPFDARPDPRPRPDWENDTVETCSSYMEPFEAQRFINELQHGTDWGRSSPQLYDSPYEERSRPRGSPAEDERESRLPQDDERPADEYDQPWEWKKENISKAFAATFDARDWDQSTLPRNELQWAAGASRSCGSASLHKTNSPHGILGERVDPALPLEKQISCHGFMHMKFSQSREGKFILGENSPPFDSISEVIHYYTTQKLPIRGAEHLSLLFPVLVQTL